MEETEYIKTGYFSEEIDALPVLCISDIEMRKK
jgi:hypothetical protein